MNRHETVCGILLAGGTGSRMGAGINKVLLPLNGIPCIARSAKALEPFVDMIVLVGRPEERNELRAAIDMVSVQVPVLFAPGGQTRQESVLHGLQCLREKSPSDAWVLIHDGARCLVDQETIRKVLSSLREKGAGVAAVPVSDTLRRGTASGEMRETISRDGVYAMQTPQGFRLGELLTAFEKAQSDGFTGTDDASVMLHAGYSVYLTAGNRNNLKITTPEDLAMAESMLYSREAPTFRIGQGYDVHKLQEGRKLILCGIEIPSPIGLLGHSDADVAVHALMDALLGAAGLGDIGRHFPDTDEAYRGISSILLLRRVYQLLREKNLRPGNIDVTIVAQKPKLAPYIPLMAEKVASELELPVSCVNVKATTTEHLGFEGRMEGISAQAVCLLQSFPSESVL